MSPIAVYEAKRPSVRLRFELYADSVRAVGSRGGVDFDVTLPLARLDSRPERLWTHTMLFYVGGFLVLLAAVLLMTLVTVIEFQDRPRSLARPYSLIGSLGVVGLVVAFANSHKIEHVRFRNDVGIPVLDIPRDRHVSQEFSRFVADLIEGVCKARGEPRPADLIRDDLDAPGRV